MNYTTKAIVFSNLKYGDKSLIIKAYTDTHGLISFISARKKAKQNLASLYQPFNRLQLNFSFQNKKSLQRIKESCLESSYASQTSIVHSSIKLFLSELCLRLIQEEEENNEIFNFLWDQTIALETTQTNLANFNIDFIREIVKVIGISPNYDTLGEFFDFREAQFVFNKPNHNDYIEGIRPLLKSKNPLSKNQRSIVLNFYLYYLEAQFGGNISKLKSLQILQTVFA